MLNLECDYKLEGDTLYRLDIFTSLNVFDIVIILQISAFFLFSNFRKADCSIFTLLVGRLVGWSVDVTINFFNI